MALISTRRRENQKHTSASTLKDDGQGSKPLDRESENGVSTGKRQAEKKKTMSENPSEQSTENHTISSTVDANKDRSSLELQMSRHRIEGVGEWMGVSEDVEGRKKGVLPLTEENDWF
jgi:hypothetical protein